MPSLDDIVDPALALVSDADGEPVGTAFRVDPSGGFLTCHHVAVDARGGTVGVPELWTAPIEAVDDATAWDLALLRCPAAPGAALPVETDAQPAEYWTKGYAWTSESVPGAVPLRGPVIGKTATLRYESGDQVYEIAMALVLGENHAFASGLSGAPVLDPSTAVVVGVAVASYKGGAPYDGFAVALGGAGDPIAAAVLENRRSVARRGRFLNAPRALEVCRAQTAAVIRAMESNRQGRRLPPRPTA
jgi:hypothetical protein